MKTWICLIFAMTSLVLALNNFETERSLSIYRKSEPVIRLKNFEAAKATLSPKDQDLLKLWESILTGRSAPLSKIKKQEYRSLALNHLFSPSGFHLSAALFPIFKILKSSRYQLILMIIMGIGLSFIPGYGALKRMIYIKSGQKMFSLTSGFIFGLIFDLLFGSFQSSPISFIYSFLFLGIIYSGFQSVLLFFWFFLGQLLVALFQGTDVSPILLVLSPILNLGFGLAMPILVLLAIPLWGWQLKIGLFILGSLQSVVDLAYQCTEYFPLVEVHLGLVLVILALLLRKWKLAVLSLIILSPSLNLDRQRVPQLGRNVFFPQGKIIKVVSREDLDVMYFEDGKCRRKLVRGFYWENCSPKKRRSSHGSKFKKLSYPS